MATKCVSSRKQRTSPKTHKSKRKSRSRRKSRRKSKRRSRRKSKRRSRRKSKHRSRRKHKMWSAAAAGSGAAAAASLTWLRAAAQAAGEAGFQGGDYYHDYSTRYDPVSTGRRTERWLEMVGKIEEARRLKREEIIGTQLAKKQNYQERALKRAVYTPEKIRALHEIARTAQEGKNYKGADDIYSSILIHVEDISTLLMLAYLRMEHAHLYVNALELYNKVLELAPGNPWALFYSSWIMYLEGTDRALANQRITDLLRQGPQKNLRAILSFLQIRNTNDIDEAIRYLGEVLQKLPKDLIKKPSELQRMQKGISNHIEVLRKRRQIDRPVIEDEDVDLYGEQYFNSLDDDGEGEIEGYND
jgi:tetratricopeptide (TPR) repeat protein